MRFIQISDAQLGYRQYGLVEREEDFTRAFQYCVDKAVELKVDAVILSGDQFEFVKPHGETVDFVKACVDQLKAANIQVVGIEGNHDMANGHWLSVCGITNLETDPITIGGIGFGGLNYRREPKFMNDLDAYLKEHEDPMHVFVMHQSIIQAAPFTILDGLDIARELAPRHCGYLALGHLHGYGQYDLNGMTACYPGSIEMTDINEDRKKFFAEIDIKPDEDPKITMHPIPVKPIIQYTVNTDEDVEKLCEIMTKEGGSLIIANIRRDVIDGYERVSAAAQKLGIPCRLSKFNEKAQLATISDKPTWERDKGLIDLKSVVEQDHEKGTDEYQLITQILDTPANAEMIVNNYIKEKMAS